MRAAVAASRAHHQPVVGERRRGVAGVAVGFRLSHRIMSRGGVRRGIAEFIQRGQFRPRRRHFAGKPVGARVGVGDGALVLRPPRGEHGVLRGQFRKLAFAAGERRFRVALALGGGDLPLGIGGVQRHQPGLFLRQPREDGGVVGDHALLAPDVVAKLRQSAVELGQPRVDARLLLVERLAGQLDALERRAGARGLVAQVRHGGGRLGLLARRGRLRLRALGGGSHRLGKLRVGFGHRRPRRLPAQVEHRRLRLADFGGKVAVAGRLARLALQRVHPAARSRRSRRRAARGSARPPSA